MRAPLSWLCDFATFDQPVEVLADGLSSLGLVVEGIDRVGEDIPEVVVAGILDIRPHPSADRIRLVDVDAGDGQVLQIACGAWNMDVGDLVPLAKVGAVLPGGMEIARRKMRGEWSNGMLCSPTEIGLPPVDGVDGLLILLPGSAVPGTPIAEAIGGADVVFDLDVSPNRPDAQSMAGVARDLAAWLGLAWAWPTGLPTSPAEPAGAVRADPGVGRPAVTIDAPDLCPLFTATVIDGVSVGTSPAWLARRLTLAGLRPINSVVDVSNYVMLDTGQPNHAYDLDRLAGGGVLVRRATTGEQVVTLDDKTRSLTADDLLICDATSAPVGIAGVMGSASTEVGPATNRLLLEAAWFAPGAVAATGTRTGLQSEARYRFERGVDTEVAGRAAERFATLISGVGPEGSSIRIGPRVEVRSPAALPVPARVPLRLERVNAVLGTDLDADAVTALLRPIGFGIADADPTPTGAPSWTVDVPTWRPDTAREIDVIEEVARHHGLQNIERHMPPGARTGALTGDQRRRRQVRDVLCGSGLDEAWTTTFLAPGDLERAGLPTGAVEVANPIDRAESVLRTSLLPGLLGAARFNRDRQQPDIGLFEIGRVFAPPSTGATVPDEREDLAVVLTGDGVDARSAVRHWSILRDALGVVGTSLVGAEAPGLHPTRTALLLDGEGRPFGAVGEVDPDVVGRSGLAGRVGWLSVSLDAVVALPTRPLAATPVSRFPASDIDLAFLVDDAVPAGTVLGTLAGSGEGLLESIELWDVYRGDPVPPGRRSLTFRLRFRAADRTLGEAELAAARATAIEAAERTHGAELRG